VPRGSYRFHKVRDVLAQEDVFRIDGAAFLGPAEAIHPEKENAEELRFLLRDRSPLDGARTQIRGVLT
jgi:hypothetical protein